MTGLLIRSTSLQHTALVVDKITDKFADIKLDILTHTHVIESLKRWYKAGDIISYPFSKGFSLIRFFLWYQKRVKRNRYDTVIIPSENMSGIGYENLFAVAVYLSPCTIVLCNKVGDIILFSRNDALRFLLKRIICYFPAFFTTAFLGLKLCIKIVCTRLLSLPYTHK